MTKEEAVNLNTIQFLETAVESLIRQRDALLDIIEELRNELEDKDGYIEHLLEEVEDLEDVIDKEDEEEDF